MIPFVLEQPVLPPAAATVAAERPVRADDAVARNDDRNPVLTVDPSDGPHRGRGSHLAGHVRVTPGLAKRDSAECLPRLQLELRAALIEPHREALASPCEVLAKLLSGLSKNR